MSGDALSALEVAVQPMTAEGFAPFGRVFGHGGEGGARSVEMLDFRHRGLATLGTIWNPHGATEFSRLERHFAVTQAFVQLSGAPAVVCVAAATDDDPMALPDPREVVGFRIDPRLGYLFHRGTWHSLDRYPLAPPGAMFLIVNSDPNPTQIVDYATGRNEMHDDLGAGGPPRELPSRGHSPCRFRVRT